MFRPVLPSPTSCLPLSPFCQGHLVSHFSMVQPWEEEDTRAERTSYQGLLGLGMASMWLVCILSVKLGLIQLVLLEHVGS
jgi:hypothetical protein